MFTPFFASDVFFADVKVLEESCGKHIMQANTIGFEIWICKILLGAAKTKAKNPSKAITAKHVIYTNHQKGEPSTMVHKALWAIAKPQIGEVKKSGK